jgi:hypothetical protein
MKKLLLLLLICNLRIVSVLAQAPANDNCSGAVALTVNADNLCAVTLTGTTVGATESQVGCNFTSADDDVWYKFTATASSHKIQVASNSGSLQNPVFEVFSGGCGSLSSLGCVNNQSFTYDTERTILKNLSVGNEYFIRVYSVGSSAFSKGTFTICVSLTIPPANDNCAGALSLLVNQNQTCTLSNAGTSEEATLSMAGCYFGSQADDDVWYAFTATSTVHKITLTPGTIKFPILEVFSGTCGSLTSLYCKPDFINNFTIGDLTIGQKYYLRAYSYNAGYGPSGTFTICINEGIGMPANDGCSGAIALTANNSSCVVLTSGTLVNATGPLTSSCVSEPIRNDVWYKFTATNAEMILKLLNTTFSSSNLELFSGFCGTFTSLACSETSENFLSYTNFTVGQEYYLRVWDRYGSTGTFNLCLSTTLSNDKSAFAVSVPVNTNFACTQKINGDNSLAFSNETSNNGCPTIKDGVWYKFVANNDSLSIELTTLSMSSGSRFELFHKQGSNLFFLEEQQRKLFKTNFSIGEEYFILVHTCSSFPTNRGTFELCVKNFPPPPANDPCENAQVVSINPNLTCTLKASGTTVNALAGIYSNCSGEVDDDVWYKFIATNTKHAISVTPGTIQDAVFQVYDGACETLNELNCFNNSSNQDNEIGKVPALVVGNTYFVRVFSSNVGSGQGTFDLCVNLPIPNEDCEDAVILTPGATCKPVSGTTFGVTTDRYDNCDFNKYGVYYKFTAAGTSQIIRLTRGTIQNVYIDLLQNNCGDIDRIGSCGSPSNAAVVDKVVSGLTVGTDYLIWINTVDISDEGSFNICVLNTVPPTNDNCASATALTVNASNVPVNKTAGTTLFATESLVGCSGNADDDVWYSFTATQTTHRLFLKTLVFNGSLEVQLFSGTCGALVSKQCISSGFSGLESSSSLLAALTIGETYFFRVYSSGGANNGGTFSVAITSTPTNDNCAQAINLSPTVGENFSTAVAGSSLDATLSSNDCHSSNFTDDDVWYTFTATQKVHKIKLQGWSSNVGRIQVFSGTCTSLVSISCNGNTFSGDTLIITLPNLAAGTPYFLRAYSASFNTFQSLFKIAVTTPILSPIDDCENAQLLVASNTNTCNTTVVSNLNAYNSNVIGTCSDNERDIYLKFVATSVQHQIKVASVSGNSFNVSFLSGTCGSLSSLRCGGTIDSLFNIGNLTAGQTYFIRISTANAFSDNFRVCITSPTFVANDECTGAEELTIAGSTLICKPISGNLLNSSQSMISECNVAQGSGATLFRDIWYKFTAVSTQQRIRFSKISGVDFKYELYGGTCGAMAFQSCSANITTYNETVFQNLTVGNTYFIRVYTANRGALEFEACLKSFVPPANDLCSTAAILPVNATWSAANNVRGTTFDADATIGSNTCGQANAFDVWYQFTATNTSHNLVFQSDGSFPNLVGMTVAVYAGTCGTLTQIFCKVGDFSSITENLLKVTGLTIGQTYFVKVYSSTSVTSSQGNFSIQVNDETTAPLNNDCTTPTALTVYNNASSILFKGGNTTNATLSGQSLICSGIGTADDDIWYSFVATKTRMRLSLFSTFVLPNFAVYSGNCTSLASVLCSTASSGTASQERIIENLTAGQTYLVRVFSSSNSATIRGRISIGISDDIDPPANDLCANAVSLSVSNSNTPTFVSGTTVMARLESNSCSFGGDVWYKFTATATTHRIHYEGFIQSAQIGLFSGTCAVKTFKNCEAAIHGTAFSATSLVIGTEYLISVGSGLNTLIAPGNFKIAVSTPSVPVNNLCSGAIPLVSGSYHSTNLATADTPDCYYKAKQDIWFTMTATSEKMKILVDNLNTNSAVTVYSGTCGSLTQVACSYSSNVFGLNKNIVNLSALTIGQSYLVRVISTGENTSGFFPVEIPLEFRIFTENNPDPTENPLFAATCLNANLVPNPGFEYFETCPDNFIPTPATPGQWISPNNHWKIPTMGSSDYFNDCAIFSAPIESPHNSIFGIQNPRNGTAHGGFFAGGASTYREYVSTKLTSPMVVGKKYVLSMYVSRADYYPYTTNNIGFGLNKGDISVSTYDTLLVDKVLLPTVNEVITESESWVNIAVSFVADQAYTHLYLGNFKGQKNSLTTITNDISGGAFTGYGGQANSSSAYYFVDDVLVTEVSNTIACGASNCDNAITLVRPTDDISGGTANKKTNLELKANITIQGSSNVLFQSGKSILMDSTQGIFEVKNGVVFEAKIGGCVN